MSSWTQKFNRPRPVAWAFFLAAFGLTLYLGSWQVERLHWKRGLIRTIAEANDKAPLTQLPTDAETLETMQFARVKLRGSWVGDTEFHLAPRYWHNTFGYAIVAPFTLTDGRILLVNRGWVPAANKQPETRPQSRVKGAATVEGLVRVGAERSYFTPANNAQKNIWFGRDITEMAAAAHLSRVVPVMVDQVGVQDAAKLPVPSDGTIRLRNDHLSYILTWYGIAFGVLVIFITYHRKKP